MHRLDKSLPLASPFVFLSLFLCAALAPPVALAAETEERPRHEAIAIGDLPASLREWADSRLADPGIAVQSAEGSLYVLIAWGRKPTGGYAAEVTSLLVEPEAVRVGVALRAPGPGDLVTQAITRPYALIRLPDPEGAHAGKSVVVSFHGARWRPEEPEEFGRGGAPPAVILTSPRAGAGVAQPVIVTGMARVFEGAFTLEIEDGHDVLARLPVQVAGAPAWGEFAAALRHEPPTSAHGMLMAVVRSPADGTREEPFRVPVRFEQDPTFPDLTGHWAAGAIARAVEEGWVSGYPDRSFRPENPVTRAEFLKLLAAAWPLPPLPGVTGPLSGVAGHWAARDGWLGAALWAGIAVPSDYEGGRFDPDRPIDRLEIATMLVRALHLQGEVTAARADGRAKAVADRWPDAGILPEESRAYLAVAAGAGLAQGYPDGRFAPRGTATRAEAVVLIQRAREVR